MKKHNLLILLVLSLAKLHGQGEVTSYTPTRSGTVGILNIVVIYSPEGASGYANRLEMRHADTAQMRKYMTAERAFQLAESDRYEALQIEARAKHDSLYAALEVLNEGLGAVDGPEPLREPSRPDDGPVFRWGAILRNDETEIG